jgi:hypothetical protein
MNRVLRSNRHAGQHLFLVLLAEFDPLFHILFLEGSRRQFRMPLIGQFLSRGQTQLPTSAGLRAALAVQVDVANVIAGLVLANFLDLLTVLEYPGFHGKVLTKKWSLLTDHQRREILLCLPLPRFRFQRVCHIKSCQRHAQAMGKLEQSSVSRLALADLETSNGADRNA